ncbi:hypothetical protein [Zavarzinia sp.]|uniref:hypothetical protein n=1 Tax=Zavarzinia sp. TaxID=2027920 RepID=UPI003BB4C3D2
MLHRVKIPGETAAEHASDRATRGVEMRRKREGNARLRNMKIIIIRLAYALRPAPADWRAMARNAGVHGVSRGQVLFIDSQPSCGGSDEQG